MLELKMREEEEREQRMKNGEEIMNEGTGELGQKIKSCASACDRSVTITDTKFFLTDFRSK